jgi:hypothetical protein
MSSFDIVLSPMSSFSVVLFQMSSFGVVLFQMSSFVRDNTTLKELIGDKQY